MQNSSFTHYGLPSLACSERQAYFDSLSDTGIKSGERKLIRDAYVSAFHEWFAENHPYLRFEIGEDKCWWEYDEEEGTYKEMTSVTVREKVIAMLIEDGLNNLATEATAKNILSRYRATHIECGSTYADFDNGVSEFHAANGWLDFGEDGTVTFSHHTPTRLSCRKSKTEYDPNATCPTYDSMLDKDFRLKQDAVRVIDQFSGLTLTGETKYQKMLTLIGKTGSGKSTLLDAWVATLGDKAMQMSLSKLSDDSFRWAGQEFARRNLCWFDEVEAKRSEMNNKLGTLITGKTISVERKTVNGIIAVPNTVKCVLTANDLPNSLEKGMYRRLIVINFERSFEVERIVNIDMGRKLEGERSGILNRMVKGLCDLKKMGGFTMIEGQLELIEEIKSSTDVIAEFLSEFFEPGEEDDRIASDDMFGAFANSDIGSESKKYYTPARFSKALGSQTLSKFYAMTSHRGSKGKRFWKNIKVRDDLKMTGEGMGARIDGAMTF